MSLLWVGESKKRKLGRGGGGNTLVQKLFGGSRLKKILHRHFLCFECTHINILSPYNFQGKEGKSRRKSPFICDFPYVNFMTS